MTDLLRILAAFSVSVAFVCAALTLLCTVVVPAQLAREFAGRVRR